MRFSDLTLERWRRFKGIRRAYYSLILLSSLFVLSLFSECIAERKPIIMSYQDSVYFPLIVFYSGKELGQQYGTEADYKALVQTSEFQEEGWAIFPPVPFNPEEPDLEDQDPPPHPPSFRHWLGTDSLGRDVFARLLYGFRICMLFSLSLTIVSGVLGVIIGGIQGYLGGRTDIVMQRLIEVWSALPFLYVVILLGSIYGQNFWMLLVVMSLFSWVGLSYYMRGEFFKLRGQTYVQAARASGLSSFRIFLGQILPNALTPLITILPFTLIAGISSLTALDFLGFGLPPPTPSWGELLQQAMDNLDFPWIAISTVTALFLTLLMATFIGEGAREAFDPKFYEEPGAAPAPAQQ
ncbi:MAG TPA: ABC transporter permease [Leptospiraceae bacterium]|nr:ABC transporter permease [Spirochaetaceae bacterium]HBS04188.1 ABC transporter permease [Leptospiraceae bacterium]|tara:strand:+ start:37106 stop:38161 length:1056 start_codon:yes stop_codon:yes gene_type:complete